MKRKADSITPTFEPASPNKPASTVLEGTPSTPPALPAALPLFR